MVSVPRSGISSSIVCSQIDLGLRPRIQHSLIFGQLNKHLFSKNKTIQSNSFKSGHCVIIKLIKVTLITVENMINIKKSQCPLKDGSPNTDQHWQILNQPSFIALLFLCLNPSPSSFPKINPKWIYGGNYIECIRNSLHMPQFTFPFQPSQCL